MKIIITRFGAFGDVIHASHLPRLCKEYYKPEQLDVEVNHKGYQIFLENPYIDNLIYTDPQQLKIPMGFMIKHFDYLKEKYDMVINLFDSIEHSLIAMEDSQEYYMSTKVRQAKYGKANFYDAMTAQANLPELYFGTGGELYFSAEEEAKTNLFIHKHIGESTYFILNLGGTSLQKKFVCINEVVESIRAEFPEVKIVITGDESNRKYAPKDFDVDLIALKVPFRQAMVIAKYAAVVISPESGFAVAAGALSTPCVQMLTTSNRFNHSKNDVNAFPLQSDAPCSCCHKGPYRFIGCPSKDGLPICTHFKPELVMEQVRRAYARSRAITGSSKIHDADLSAVRN